MSLDQLKCNKKQLGVEEYKRYHNVKLYSKLKKQYRIHNDLDNMLLSSRAKETPRDWTTCRHCKLALQDKNINRTKSLKWAIANGFCIGKFPKYIVSISRDIIEIDMDELPDELRTSIAPVRPHGNIYAFVGGAQKTIQGTVAYYESDLPQIGGAFKHAREMGLGQNICIMLCGRFTPNQR